jgi:hypothetical protein
MPQAPPIQERLQALAVRDLARESNPKFGLNFSRE